MRVYFNSKRHSHTRTVGTRAADNSLIGETPFSKKRLRIACPAGFGLLRPGTFWRYGGVDNTHGLLSEWWSAHATGLTSVCLHSCPTGLTAGGLEAVPDTIGLLKVDLVGCWSDKSVMGHLGVVLFDVEIDQTPELHEAVERMQVQPLMT